MPELKTANLVDYVLIGLYFALIVWVGVYAARRNQNTNEYFTAGGKIPWLFAGLSNWVSGYSAYMFVAAAGFTYRNGAGAILLFTSAAWAYLLGYFFFSVRWRRARLHSPLEFLTRRYSPSTTYFYSLVAIIPQIIGIAQWLYVLCIFVSTALGFNERMFAFGAISITGFQLAIIFVGMIMVIYSAIGGLWAAVLSDAVQAVIIIVMTLIIFPVSYLHLGEGLGLFAGFERLLREAPPEYFRLQGETASGWFLFAYLLSVVLGYNVGWALVQRYHSVPDERDARKMALLCAGLALVGPMLWILPVMASRLIFPNIAEMWPAFAVPAEASFVSLALLLLPHGLIGFVVSAILSATLGQANDSFNWLSATLTREVYVPWYQRLRKALPSEQNQLFVARMTMFIVGVLGVTVALYIPKLGGAFQFALNFHSLNAAFMMPVALGILYTRTPWWSGIATCSAAVSVGLILMAMGVWAEQAFVRNLMSESLVALLVFFGSAFFFKKDDPRHGELLHFETDLKTPVLVERVQFDVSGFGVYDLVGKICLILGVVLCLCAWLPASALAPARLNAYGGGMLLLLGGAILSYLRAKSAKKL